MVQPALMSASTFLYLYMQFFFFSITRIGIAGHLLCWLGFHASAHVALSLCQSYWDTGQSVGTLGCECETRVTHKLIETLFLGTLASYRAPMCPDYIIGVWAR